MITIRVASARSGLGRIRRRSSTPWPAPVSVDSDATAEDLVFLAAHDDDPFARYEALQTLATTYLVKAAQGALSDADKAQKRGEIGKALGHAPTAAAYDKVGLIVSYMGAADFGKFWDAEIGRFALAIKASGAAKD